MYNIKGNIKDIIKDIIKIIILHNLTINEILYYIAEFIITIYTYRNINIKSNKNIIILKKINIKNSNYFNNFIKIMLKKYYKSYA